jgi:hypothetical protein
VEFLLPVERRLKAAALLREHVQQHRGGRRVLRNLKVSISSGRLWPSMGPKYSRPNSSNRMEGQSMLLAASSARRATLTAVLPPKRSTNARADRADAGSARW